MAETGLPSRECLELILLVDDYVFGYIERFNPIHQFVGDDPASLADRYSDELAARLAELDMGPFPNLRALVAEAAPQEWLTRLVDLAVDPGRFDRGLELLLDGIEQHLAKSLGRTSLVRGS